MPKAKLKMKVNYKLSADGAGLLFYYNDTDFYHVHSGEMSEKEMEIWRSLTAKSNGNMVKVVQGGVRLIKRKGKRCLIKREL